MLRDFLVFTSVTVPFEKLPRYADLSNTKGPTWGLLYLTKLLLERHADQLEERSRFGFCLCRRHESDREAEDVLDFLIDCLRKDGVLLDRKRHIADVVDGCTVEPAEVLCARKRHIEKLIEESVHARAAERHHDADRLTLTELEARNRFLCATECRFLASDLRDAVCDQVVSVLVFPDTRAGADINDRLDELRSGHFILVAKLPLERFECLLFFLFYALHMSSVIQTLDFLLALAADADLLAADYLLARAGLHALFRINKHEV